MILGTLKYSFKTEVGDVAFNADYRAWADDVVKLDVLKDWLHDIQAEYDRVHAITFPRSQDDEGEMT